MSMQECASVLICDCDPGYTCVCESKADMVLYMSMCRLMHGHTYNLVGTGLHEGCTQEYVNVLG